MNHPHPLASLGLVLASAIPAQQEFVVDGFQRPGSTHTTIQAAVDAASPGDRIVVRKTGNVRYPGFTLTKGLDIRGNYQEFPEVTFADIRSIPAGESVHLERLFLWNPIQPAVELRSCDGAVVLRQLFVLSNALISGALPALTMFDCEQVLFETGGVYAHQIAACGVSGSSAVFRGVQIRGSLSLSFGDAFSEPGMVISSSDVVLHDCEVTGGEGAAGSASPFGDCLRDGTDGSAALISIDSDVLVTGSSHLAGGRGGVAFGSCRPGEMGPALVGSVFRIDPSVVLEGDVDAEVRRISTQPSLSGMPVVLDAGSSTTFSLTADADAAWTLFVDLAPGRVEVPGIEAPFLLTPTHLPILLGAVPTSGDLVIPIATGRDPALIERVLWFQAGAVSPSGEVRLSNAGSMRLR